MIYIVGLGNPGEEYEETRHNAGRMGVEAFIKKLDLPEPVASSKYASLISEGTIGKGKGKQDVLCILPETFMNKSGSALKPIVGAGSGPKGGLSPKKAEGLIVVHDDLDMPLGKIKILFNRGSGGHKGLESIIRTIKTEAFIRIKVGISGAGSKGKVKKPSGDKLLDFIVGKFKPAELAAIKKVAKEVADAIETIVLEGKDVAMGIYNQK